MEELNSEGFDESDDLKEYPIRITKHAEQRIKERMGLKRKAQKRMINKVIEQGINQSEMPKLLRDWVTVVVLRNSPKHTHGYIYDNVLFLINEYTVITVLTVPGKLNRFVQIAINDKQLKESSD